MVKTRKTKAQLIDELEALQAKIASLERSNDAPRLGNEYVCAVAENAPVGIAVYRQGVALYVNQVYARMAGYSDSAQLVGNHFADLVAPPYREELIDLNRRRELGEKVPTTYETMGLRKDGTEFPIRVQATRLELPDGPATVGFFTDISEWKQVQEAARQAEAQYRDIYENAIEGIFQSTPQGTFLSVNPAMAHIYGYESPQEMLDAVSNIAYQIHADSQTRAEFTRLLDENGKVEKFEVRNLRKDGSIIWTSTNARAVRDESGAVIYYEGALQDITERKQAEEQLLLLKLSVDAASDGVYWMDVEGRFLYFNEAGCKALGYSPDELKHMRVFDVNPQVTPERWAELWDRLRKEGRFYSKSVHRRKGGSLFPVEISSTYLQFGGQEYCNGFAHDITDRMRTEEALRESEERSRIISELTTDYAFIADVDSQGALKLRWTSDAMTRVTGRATSDVQASETWKRIIVPEDQNRFFEFIRRIIDTRQPGEIECRSFRGEGTVHWLQIIASPRVSSENSLMIVGAVKDITGRKQAEEALRESEGKFRTMADQAPLMIGVTDESGNITFLNKTWLDFRGKSLEEEAGWAWAAGLHPEDRDRIQSAMQSAIARHSPYSVEYRIQDRHGNYHWFLDTATPLLGSDGQPQGYVGTALDITDRKQVEEALRESEEKFRHIVESSPMGMHMYRLEPDNRLVFIGSNPAADRILGVENSQFVGKTIEEAFPPLVETEAPERYRLAAAKGEAWYADQIIYEEGKISGAFEVQAFQTSPNHMVAMFLDVTARKRAEEVLKQYTVRLETLHEIDQAILLAETPQAIAEAALGHLRELIPCQRASVAVFDFEHDEVELLASHISGTTQIGTGVRIPVKKYGVDEELLHGKMTLINDLALVPHLSDIRQTLLSEGIHSVVNVPLVIQGELIGSLNLGAAEPAAFTDERIEMACEVADQLAITIQHARLRERDQRHTEELEMRVAERTVELRAAYEQLQSLTRVKDEFVSNVSHELRTPIASVKTYLHLLAERPEKQEKYIETLKRELNRLEHLIEGLLILSRLDQDRVTKNLTNVDLNNLIGEYITDRTPLAESKNLTLMFSPSMGIPSITGDRQLLGEVLSILLTNAFNYTSAGGQVTIHTQTRKAEDGCWAGFSVGDSGWGISPEELPLLFERFYRGKAAQKTNVSGTGLGLSIAREIIDLHCGHIKVHSDGIPGHGTTFDVWLPAEE